MKKLIWVLLTTAALSLGADAAAEKDVMAALNAWKQAATSKSRAGFEKVYHPDLRYGHSSGLIENKADAIKHIVDSKGVYETIDFVDSAVTVVGNTALVTGKVNIMEKNSEGKRAPINLVVLHVFTKTPQGWQMVGRQSTRPTP